MYVVLHVCTYVLMIVETCFRRGPFSKFGGGSGGLRPSVSLLGQQMFVRHFECVLRSVAFKCECEGLYMTSAENPLAEKFKGCCNMISPKKGCPETAEKAISTFMQSSNFTTYFAALHAHVRAVSCACACVACAWAVSLQLWVKCIYDFVCCLYSCIHMCI